MGLLDSIFKKRRIVRNKDTGNFMQRYIKSFCHALDGISYAVLCEHNMIIIIIAAVVVTVAGIAFNINNYEWLFVIGIVSAVSASEMINTAVEACVDLTTNEIHPLAKIAKDTASSATLILSIGAFIGAIIIFLPKIIEII